MKQYLDMLSHVLHNGEYRETRTGVNSLSVFGGQMRFDLNAGYPLVTTKKVYFKGVVHELLWFLSGDTNTKYLVDNGVHIWDAWARPDGSLGPVYGAQWRNFGGVDQIEELIKGLKSDPYSRRHVVSAWNVPELKDMVIPPCHTLFQFYVSTKGKLSCQLYQRSADIFLGVPFNIASYALLTHMLAQELGYGVGEFVWSGGDIHLYENHVEQAKVQLLREPKALPQIHVSKVGSIYDYVERDISLVNYDSYPALRGEVAV